MTHAYFTELGDLYGRLEASVAGEVLGVAEAVGRAVQLIRARTAAGRKVMFVGNGGSSAIASHQAIDLWRNGGIRAIAFNDPVLLTCVSNDFGYPRVFEKPIDMFGESGDVLVAISSSGKSENILLAVEAARRVGASVITMSGFQPDNPLRRLGDLNFYVPSGSYGHVEIAHLTICHCIADTLTASVGAPEAS